MPFSPTCPQCGAVLKGRGLGGLCPRCVGQGVLASDEEDLAIMGADADEEYGPSTNEALPSPDQEPELELVSERYRLLRRIGEGGFGEIYLAEQIEPVKRQVALKLLKPGMDSKQFVIRFEAERQALAMMDHPHIARVHDAGVTPTGRPYYVMEWVQGIKVTDFCETNQLPTRERLELFIKICRAVQHAHQKGVIHRDIKPSNILVALHEGVPTPKVIDFGIAKAVGGLDLTDKTLFTGLQQFLGTPTYMSPEQVVMGGVDVDTRTDVYSLGVLLYELLTGRTPFDAKALMERGIEELILTLRDVEPARPSTRMRKLDAEALTTLAQHHRTNPSQLVHQIRRDLDWIVMKCLEKDRTRRYETANGLAMDIQRHLRNEPVLARPPSKLYEFQKTVRRHKFGFAATAAIFLVLAIGIALTTWQAIRATRSEQAQSRLRQEAQARAYAADMRLAQQALSTHNLGRTRMLLDRHRPESSEDVDRRGWEWRYLWQQSRGEALDTLCQTSNWVYSLSVSADGNWLAVGERQDGGLSVWDLKAKKKVATLPGGLDRVQVAFSPREPLLAFSAITSPSENRFKSSVFLWDGSTRKIEAELPLTGDCEGIAFSGNGSTLATFAGGSESQVSLWHVADGARLTAYSTIGIQDSPGHKVAFDRDLTVAASGLTEGRVRIFDALTGTERRTVTVTDGIVNAVALSADGKILAGATGFDDGVLYLWEVETGHQIARLTAHRGRIDTLRFWPDGKRLVSGSSDQSILLWDLASLPDLPAPRRLRGHRRTVCDVALLPDHSTLASGSEDRSVLLWDRTSVRQDHSHIALSGAFVAWHWAADSRSVLTVDENGRVVRWHGVDFQEQTTLLETSPDLSAGLFSSDLSRLATASADGKMRIWDISRGKLLSEFEGGLWPRKFLSDGKTLIVKDSQDGRIKELNLVDRREFRSWETQGRLLADIISADGRWLVRLLDRGELRLNDRMTDHEIPLNPPLRGAYGATFSADGSQVAVASYFGLARVWETSTGREIATFTGFEQGVHSVGFSPDGKRLATSSQGSEALKLWDMDSLQELLTLPAREEIFITTEFSPDGNVLAAMHYKQGLHLWRAPSLAEIEVAEEKRNGEAR